MLPSTRPGRCHVAPARSVKGQEEPSPARRLSGREGWFAEFHTARLTWPVGGTEELFICSSERIVTSTGGVRRQLANSGGQIFAGIPRGAMRSPRRPAHMNGAKNAHAVRWREIRPTPVAYNQEMRHNASAGPPLQWRLAVLRCLSIAEVLAAFDTAAPL